MRTTALLRHAAAFAVVLLFPRSVPAQKAPPDPNDAAVAELKRIEPRDLQYIRTHPGAVPLAHRDGQLRFKNADNTQTVILGAVTHQDPNTGDWVAQSPVLAATKDGYRIDGASNDILIKKRNSFQQTITQTFTDFRSKHDSVLSLTAPTLAYDNGMNFHFSQDGLLWNLRFDPSGAFDLVATVNEKRGLSKYTFDVSSSEALTADASGSLVGDAHVNLTRAVVITSRGQRILCSPWTYSKQAGASFTCDDSKFRPEWFPYQIDPSSQTLTNGGTYYLDRGYHYLYNEGGDFWYWGETGHASEDVSFNTAGLVPSGSLFPEVSCAFDVVTGDGADTTCQAGTFNNFGTTTVQVVLAANSCGCEYDRNVTVHNVSLTVTYLEPPRQPSPATGSIDQSVHPTLSWVGDGGSYFRLYFGTTNPPPQVTDIYGVNSYTPPATLSYSTVYYWKVETWGYTGAFNWWTLSSPVWSFTTAGPIATPQFNPAAGTYTSAQSVTLSTTAGASIRYTTDGTTPSSTHGTVYSGAISVASTTTLKAIAFQSGYPDSQVATAAFTITGTVASPSFSPVAGTYITPQTVTLSSTTSGASIRYTLDGSTPSSTNGTLYAGAISISATTTIKAIAYKATWADSTVASGTFTITGTVATPTFSVPPGFYTTVQTVSLSTTTPSASIRYTTNGTAPTSTTGTVYSGPITISTPTTLQAIAYKAGWADSAVASATYMITYQYFVTDPLTSFSGNWTQAGSMTATSGGATAPSSGGGSLISNVAVPDGTSDYEVRATVTLAASGGTYTLFARATTDSRTGGTGAGTFYAFEMQNPTFAGGGCSAGYVVWKRTGGTMYTLGSFAGGCAATSVLRMVIRPGTLMVWQANATLASVYTDSTITSGKGGVGAYSTPSGNSISNVKIGPLDRTSPSQVSAQTVGVGTFPNRVEAQWQGTADNPEGSGLAYYRILRDGAAFGTSFTPQFADESLAPGESHTYALAGVDQHGNVATATSVMLTAAPANTAEPRRVGVKTIGSYYGAAGEQIDLLSGNLNFTLPLVKAQARSGWGATFALSYNSQFWRQDSGGIWTMGRDVGYGLGWRLMAGSIVPVYSGTWNVHHWVFTDATGAEYRLDQNNGNVWTSHDGLYVSFDANSQTLYFPDGGRWYMFAQSAGNEGDAGTFYPTGMYDTNGNWIAIDYAAGAGVAAPNSSARIVRIADMRKFPDLPVFTFTYNNDPIPHLTNIANIIGTAEAYTFTYLANQTVTPPFAGGQSMTASLLQSAATTGLGVSTAFEYGSGSGEMTKMTTPLGGSLSWTYRTYTYPGSRSYREVLTRQVTPLPGQTANLWNITLSNATNLHTTATVADTGAGTTKVWTFTTAGLPATYEERDAVGAALMHKDYTWTTDASARPYVGAVLTSLNPGKTYAAQSKSEQTLDVYGNVTQSKAYDYGNLTTPAKTYNFTYLTDSNYVSRYIRNRVTQVTMTPAGGSAITLVQNYYDRALAGVWPIPDCGILQDRTMPPAYGAVLFHDRDNYGTTFPYRGNVTYTTSLGAAGTCTAYEITGVAYRKMDPAGRTMNVTPSGFTNYALPGVLTPNTESNLSTSISYVPSFAVTGVLGPNGANSTTTYDSFGRPLTTHSPDGGATTTGDVNYTYAYNPNTQTATIGTGSTARWKKTTLDGFGREIKSETGYGSTTVSVVDTEYAACACAPLGKLKRTSQPHAPGAGAVWTTNTYDGSGRTLTTTLPDGSVMTYLYQGNTIKTTDAAGKWKKNTMDAFGNLVTVTEPRPGGGADYVTTYTYNALNQMTQVSMPRPYLSGTYTQTRTFVYTGADMTSETNPENGTTTYEYNADHQVTKRKWSNGQETRYTYDAYGRQSQVQHWGWNGAVLAERLSERVDYYYDVNPLNGAFSQNAWGRLAATVFHDEQPTPDTKGEQFAYQYSYNQAGRITTQRLTADGGQPNGPVNLDALYEWDNEGRMTKLTYPGGDLVQNYGFDSMGRLSKLNGGTIAVYGVAGEMTSFNGDTRTYNSLFQLTRINAGTSMDIEYNYTAGANNGRIASSLDHVTGENVTYTYDSLNRLTKAATADNLWGNTYTYDGWGNLLSKAVFKGAAPVYSTTIDPATNGGPGQEAAPGNPALDVERRMLTSNGLPGYVPYLSYDPSGKRIFKETPRDSMNPNSQTTCEIYFYGITGQKLATYGCHYNDQDNGDGNFYADLLGRNEYFAGKPIKLNGVAVVTDRLGSVRWNGNGERFNYYPYGEERGTTANGREKFGTYFRDTTGLDYADQRYYDSTKGRFTTPDPFMATEVGSDPVEPNSWNRFAYVSGDPVNFYDPEGLFQLAPGRGRKVQTEPGPTIPINPNPPKAQPIRAEPKTNFPSCNPNDSPTDEKTLTFLQNNYDDALSVATAFDIPVEWLLGWSASETDYGTNSPSKMNNNFFSEEKSVKQTLGLWKGEIPCPAGAYFGAALDNPNMNYSCFVSFAASANAAMSTKYGTIISTMYADGADIVSTFNAVYAAGWDKSKDKIAGAAILGTQVRIKREINCLLKYHYLH